MDKRSSDALETLRPKARPWFAALHGKLNEYAAAHGLTVRITSGNRTWAERNELYAQGRTKPGPRVTNARGGSSNHNYGIAVDVTIFKGAEPVWESPHYAKLGAIGQKLGLEWGGAWQSIKDEPHFQIRVGRSVAQLRALVNASGWSAIDNLIPSFQTEANLVTPPTSAPTVLPVTVVYDDPDDGKPGKTLAIRAWLDGSRTWVNPSDFCDYFGGEFVILDDHDTGMSQVRLNSDVTEVGWRRIDGAAAVAFSAINAVLGLTYSWNGKTRTLTVHRDGDDK
jgi:hypothetical protein